MKKILNGVIILLMVGVGIYVNVILNDYGTKLEVGDCELYYKEPVTEPQAKSLSEFLKESGYFGEGQSNSVQLLRENNTFQVRLVVKPDAYVKHELDGAFQMLLLSMKIDVFDGKDTEIHLCNEELKTKRVIKEIGEEKAFEGLFQPETEEATPGTDKLNEEPTPADDKQTP